TGTRLRPTVRVTPKMRWHRKTPAVWWYIERCRTSPMICFEESMNSSIGREGSASPPPFRGAARAGGEGVLTPSQAPRLSGSRLELARRCPPGLARCDPVTISDSERPVALVTGVGRTIGIGAGIVERLAATGWDIGYTYWRAYDDRMPWGREDSAGAEIARTV